MLPSMLMSLSSLFGFSYPHLPLQFLPWWHCLQCVWLHQLSTPKFSGLSSQQVLGIFLHARTSPCSDRVPATLNLVRALLCGSRFKPANFWITTKSPTLTLLTCDLCSFANIHSQIKPPSANHLHFHFQWCFWKIDRAVEHKCTLVSSTV
jgi:hypothetical protein